MRTFVGFAVEFFNDTKLFNDDGYDEVVQINSYSDSAVREINKRCFARVLKAFLFSGTRVDAFEVYFAFVEICGAFGGKNGYERVKALVETLSDFEENAGALLEKHRDHYAHSVYVFALGLAIYHTNNNFREAFRTIYGGSACESKRQFLYMWGMTALFHDIGYPYQLAFEESKIFGKRLNLCGDEIHPTVSFDDILDFAALDNADAAKLEGIDIDSIPADINAVLARDVAKKFDLDFQMLYDLMYERAVSPLKQPLKFRTMDHGYFSAVILFKTLLKKTDTDYKINGAHVDIATAILLHNSFYRFGVKEVVGAKYSAVSVHKHPLAYLLLLCDELQCWDRAAYGIESRNELLPWDLRVHLNDTSIAIEYKFVKQPQPRADGKPTLFDKFVSGKYARDLCEEVVDVHEIAAFSVSAFVEERIDPPNKNLSHSSFISLFDFAVAVHSSYLVQNQSAAREMSMASFDELSLEYKLSNIEQAKSFAQKLESINCCYSDRETDYPRIDNFNDEEVEALARLEHIRWVKERTEMGWRYGEAPSRDKREELRVHPCLLPYDELNEEYKETNRSAMRNMLHILNTARKGVHIYRLAKDNKQRLCVAFTGHRYLKPPLIEETLRLKDALRELKKQYDVVGICQFALGADTIFANTAYELDVPIKAILPKSFKDYLAQDFDDDARKEEFAALFGRAVSSEIVTDEEYGYKAAGDRMVEECDVLIAMWDGVRLPLEEGGKLINQGGTYYTCKRCEERGKQVIYIQV